MTLTMKKYKFVSILSVLAILFALSPISAFAADPMEDISDHWAKDQIQSFVDSGYIKGYPDGTFKPDNNITRAEFMTIANNAFGYTEKVETNYSDVADGSWYEDAVAIAKAAGYIAGYSDGTMKPDAPISRQEAVVIVAKIDALEANEAAADIFNDGTTIPAWSKGAIGACVTAEILNGYPDGSFLAKNLIKRGESVIALSKALAYKNMMTEAELQAAADQAAADAVTLKIAALSAPAELTLEDKAIVDEAKAEYDALTEAQKALISTENQTKLSEAIAKIASLETTATETEGEQEEVNL